MSASTQAVRLGSKVYTVERTGGDVVTHILRGPRGGEIDGIRNVYTGVIYLMQGARELPSYLTDINGELRAHRKG